MREYHHGDRCTAADTTFLTMAEPVRKRPGMSFGVGPDGSEIRL